MSAGQLLFRVRGSERVQALVQVHDQAMQRIAFALRHRGELEHFAMCDRLRAAECAIVLDRGEPCLRRLALRVVAGLDGTDHVADVIPDGAAEVAQARRADLVGGQSAGAGHQRLHGVGVDAGGAAFVLEIEGGGLGRAGVAGGRLQHAQAYLHAVVRLQALADQRRQQDLGLSQPLDDAGFHGRDVPECAAI